MEGKGRKFSASFAFYAGHVHASSPHKIILNKTLIAIHFPLSMHRLTIKAFVCSVHQGGKKPPYIIQ